MGEHGTAGLVPAIALIWIAALLFVRFLILPRRLGLIQMNRSASRAISQSQPIVAMIIVRM
jgi:hypothetical protein